MSIRYGKKGEDAWTAELVAMLNGRRLDGAELKATPFPIYHVREGGKRVQAKPDFEVVDAGVNVGSAKVGQEVKALSTALEYKEKLPKAEELRDTSLHEVFAVSYPAARAEKFHLHVLPRPGRPKELPFTLDSLDEVADTITSVLRGDFEPLYAAAEPVAQEAARLLGLAAVELASHLKGVPLTDLEAVFGGHSFFQSVLASRLKKEKKAETLRLGAAFLYTNQALFYVLLSRAAEEAGKADMYPQIAGEDMGDPQRLASRYFSLVKAKDYEPIYGIPVAQLFKDKKASDASRDIIRGIAGLAPSIDKRDLAGQVFQTLIPFEIRKPLGAHYTHPRAAQLLAALSINRADAKVLDPACGSGTLLVASYLRKRRLAEAGDPLATHRRMVEEEITGIDAMAFAAHLAAVNLALQEPLLETDFVRIGTTDSTYLAPGAVVEPTEAAMPSALQQSTLGEDFGEPRRAKRRGPVELKAGATRTFSVDTVDIVIMNPPFTSWQNMSEPYRNSLKERFRGVVEKSGYSGPFWWRMSQQAFFLLLADKFLQKGGIVAAVLPFTTFTGRAFEPFVEYLLKNYTVRAIVVGLGRASFSEDTSLSECLFVAEKGPPKGDSTFLLVGMRKVPDDWTDDEVDLLVEDLGSGRARDDNFAVVKRFAQADVYPSNRSLATLALFLHRAYETAAGTWATLVHQSNKAAADAWAALVQKVGLPLIPFAKLTTETGIEATRLASYFGSRPASYYGASALFIIRDARRAVKKADRLLLEAEDDAHVVAQEKVGGNSYTFPRSAVARALRRFSYVPSIDVTATPDYAVKRDAGDLGTAMRAIYGSKDARKFLSRIRATRRRGGLAFRLEEGSSRLLLIRRQDLSAPGTTVLSVRSAEPILLASDGFLFRGLPKDDTAEKLLCMWFNSTPFLIQLLGRATFTRGTWMKAEDFALDRLLVPNVALLSGELKTTIQEAYKRLRSVSFPDLIAQLSEHHESRNALDDSVLSILGIRDGDERLRVARELQDGAAAALLALKRTMEAVEDEEGEDA